MGGKYSDTECSSATITITTKDTKTRLVEEMSEDNCMIASVEDGDIDDNHLATDDDMGEDTRRAHRRRDRSRCPDRPQTPGSRKYVDWEIGSSPEL